MVSDIQWDVRIVVWGINFAQLAPTNDGQSGHERCLRDTSNYQYVHYLYIIVSQIWRDGTDIQNLNCSGDQALFGTTPLFLFYTYIHRDVTQPLR